MGSSRWRGGATAVVSLWAMVVRDEHLRGPLSLNYLIMAQSGAQTPRNGAALLFANAGDPARGYGWRPRRPR